MPESESADWDITGDFLETCCHDDKARGWLELQARMAANTDHVDPNDVQIFLRSLGERFGDEELFENASFDLRRFEHLRNVVGFDMAVPVVEFDDVHDYGRFLLALTNTPHEFASSVPISVGWDRLLPMEEDEEKLFGDSGVATVIIHCRNHRSEQMADRDPNITLQRCATVAADPLDAEREYHDGILLRAIMNVLTDVIAREDSSANNSDFWRNLFPTVREVPTATWPLLQVEATTMSGFANGMRILMEILLERVQPERLMRVCMGCKTADDFVSATKNLLGDEERCEAADRASVIDAIMAFVRASRKPGFVCMLGERSCCIELTDDDQAPFVNCFRTSVEAPEVLRAIAKSKGHTFVGLEIRPQLATRVSTPIMGSQVVRIEITW